MSDSITIEGRFNGPPDSANGGYAAGLLSSQLDAGTVEVTLRSPPPLNTPLTLLREGEVVRAYYGETLVGEAKPSDLDVTADVPPPVSYEDAITASKAFGGFKAHPFPGCLVCGPNREDGLRVFAGPVKGRNVHAAPWTPAEWTSASDGLIATPLIWAGLDCTGGWAADVTEGRLALLGRITARVLRPVEAGKRYVVYGWPLGEDGRKMFSGTALVDEAGELYAAARSTWIRIAPPSSG